MSSSSFGFFEVPMLAWPRAVHYDTAPVPYLRAAPRDPALLHGRAASPNYGAYYGIAQLDAADLPIPKNWAKLRARAAEPAASCPWQFGNGGPDLCDTSPLEEFLTNAPNYEASGVKYFLLGTKTNIAPYFQPRGDVTHQTPDGGATMVLGWNAPSYFPGGVLTSITVDIYHGLPYGLQVAACSGGRCVAATPAGPGETGEVFRLAAPLTLRAAPQRPATLPQVGLTLHLVASASDPVQVITTPTVEGVPASVKADGVLLPGRGAIVTLNYVPSSLPVLVHQTKSTQIFVLPHASQIATAPGCHVVAHTMTSFTTHCTHASALLYRELSYAGWAAHVNGTTVPIHTVDGVYQRIELPAGRASVEFSYAPPHAALAWLAALLGFLIVIGSILWRLFGWTPPPPAPVGTFVATSVTAPSRRKPAASGGASSWRRPRDGPDADRASPSGATTSEPPGAEPPDAEPPGDEPPTPADAAG